MAAIDKRYLRMGVEGIAFPVQSLDRSDTGTAVSEAGLTVITSSDAGTAGVHAYQMRAPVAGERKVLVADVNSTRTVQVNCGSAVSFTGSTSNALSFSTGAVLPKRAELMGVSTTEWSVLQLSTGVTVAFSTEDVS